MLDDVPNKVMVFWMTLIMPLLHFMEDVTHPLEGIPLDDGRWKFDDEH